MKFNLFAAAFAGLAMTATASAGIITESDRNVVVAALGSNTTVETFGSDFHAPITTGVLNSATGGVAGITVGLIQPGATYSTPIGSGLFFNIDTGGGFVGGFLDGIESNGQSQPLTITFDTPTTAIGFDTSGLMSPTFTITINFADGGSFSDTLTQGTGTVGHGFTSSADDIVSAVIHGGGGGLGFGFAVDNVTFGTSAVPEPASLVIFATGLICLQSARRRARRD